MSQEDKVATADRVADEPKAETHKREHEEGDVQENKRPKVEIPEGMSKSAWKKLQKRKKWEETKPQYLAEKREKRKLARQRRKEREQEEEGDQNYHQMRKSKNLPTEQKATGINFIMDCEFDHLMNDKEIVSLSSQIARCYSAKRHCQYEVGLEISSFNKNLKERFEKAVSQYKLWKGLPFKENEKLSDIIDETKKDKYVYLTADTNEVIEQLEPDTTYIIGGIVDKNRHKKLCVNKAQELGLKVGRLPIDKYIKMNGRQVLATSHVYEIACKWFENDKDWGKAFNEVLPPRKIKAHGTLSEPAEPATESSVEPEANQLA